MAVHWVGLMPANSMHCPRRMAIKLLRCPKWRHYIVLLWQMIVLLRNQINKFHRISYHLCPWTKAFHALVPRGSMCIPVPERAGPITNHLNTPAVTSTNYTGSRPWCLMPRTRPTSATFKCEQLVMVCTIKHQVYMQTVKTYAANPWTLLTVN